MKRYIIAILSIVAFFPKTALAHCPLCVAATGGLALLAASFGVSSAVVGIVSGSFALAMGQWFARLIAFKRLPYQDWLVALLIYLTTVLPLMPLAKEYKPFFIPFIGEYGTTFAIHLFLIGAILGALIILVSPFLSRSFTRVTGKHVLFQQIITASLLIVLASLIVEYLIK